MTTFTKVLIGLGVVGGAVYVANKLAPQQKNPVSQVVDSLSGLVGAFKGTAARIAQPSVPELDTHGNVYPVTDAAIADGRGLAPTTRNAPAPSALTSQQRVYLGVGTNLSGMLS